LAKNLLAKNRLAKGGWHPLLLTVFLLTC